MFGFTDPIFDIWWVQPTQHEHSRAVFCTFRNRACDTLHLIGLPERIQRMGYVGRNSETESALPAAWHCALTKEIRSATVDCFRLACCIDLQA